MIDYRHVHHEALCTSYRSVLSHTVKANQKNKFANAYQRRIQDFPDGGGGAQTIILTSFPQKYVKIEKNWTRKGCIAGAPLINYGQPLFKKLLIMKGR